MSDTEDPLDLDTVPRNSSSSDDLRSKRRRRNFNDRRSTRRVWTEEEISLILNYFKRTLLSGNELEKPNSRSYYDTMLKELMFPNCDCISVKNKIRVLKLSYDTAIQWRNQFGDNPDKDFVKNNLLIICKNFYEMDEIYGTPELDQICINIPFKNEIPEEINIIEHDEIEVEINGKGNVIVHEYKDDILIPILPTKLDLSLNNSNNFTQSSIISTPKLLGINNNSSSGLNKSEFVKQNKTILLSGKISENTNLNFDKQKLKDDNDISKRRFLLEEHKFEFKRAKFKNDFTFREDELKYKKEELEFRRQQLEFHRQELEFKKDLFNKERDLDLEKFKIEQDFKFKLEIAKLDKN